MITIHTNNTDNTFWLKKNNGQDLFRVIKNGSTNEMLSLLQDSVNDVSIRFKMDPRVKGLDFNGDFYVWNSYYATHDDILPRIVKARIRSDSRYFFLLLNPVLKKYYVIESDMKSQEERVNPSHLDYLVFKRSAVPNIYR